MIARDRRDRNVIGKTKPKTFTAKGARGAKDRTQKLDRRSKIRLRFGDFLAGLGLQLRSFYLCRRREGQPNGKHCTVRRMMVAAADVASLMLQDISRQPEPQARSGGSLGGKKG